MKLYFQKQVAGQILSPGYTVLTIILGEEAQKRVIVLVGVTAPDHQSTWACHYTVGLEGVR